MAVPLFIFAATVCRFVGDRTWLDPEGQLAKVLDHQSEGYSELDKLDSTYRPILDQLLAAANKPGAPNVVGDFREIVGPIVLLAEPLSSSSLALLLDKPETSIHRTLQRLHAVLDVPSNAKALLRPFHLSFREFITHRTKRAGEEFWIDEKETHKNLASSCISRLGSCLKPDICNLKWPGTMRFEIDRGLVNKSLPVQVRYACLYWVSHLEQSGQHIQAGDEVHLFLQRHFLHWLEALSILGRISETVAMMKTLQRLAGVSDTYICTTYATKIS